MSDESHFFILVKDLSPYSEPWFIEVKVIRIWTTPICSNASRVNTVEMVFIDAEGTKIQGSVTRDILRQKRLDMDEGGCYEVNEALVVPNEGNDRPTQHAYRLVLQGSLEKFNKIPYKVGLLTSVTCERDYVKDDKDITAVFLELTDPTREGPMTPIIVIQFARVVPAGPVVFGDAGIESVVGVTRLLFYPSIPEVFQMNHWLTMSGIDIEGKVQYVNIGTPSISLRDEFLINHPKRELGHLNKHGGLVVVWGKIIGLLENEMWWNSSCHHRQCLSQTTCLYTCDGYYSVIPRYSLKVEVSNDKDATYLILGDEDVESLLHVSCKDLLSSMHDSTSASLPPIFNLLLGRELLFLVQKRSRINDLRETRSTIARLLGEQGAAEHFNHLDQSSYASSIPGDNLISTASIRGQPSSSASIPFNNQGTNINREDDEDEPTDKECVYFTGND
ncbi:Nucleic acid-binding, OB-fold [Sesbania bispinosa]|nr:Nucleic acid-binding, OB-fold [Sesbania bispinosa]